MGAVAISRVAEAGITREEEGSSGVEGSNAMKNGHRGHQEEAAMWPTWKALPAGWTYVMRVVLVSTALCVSACSAPGHSISNPSGMPSEGGYAGPKDPGNGNGNGYWDVTTSAEETFCCWPHAICTRRLTISKKPDKASAPRLKQNRMQAF
jgi:uncharacterized protein YbdZ (MbtH family)